MGDFYSVLRQSIIDRGLTSPEAREDAYLQARRAMINRLWAYNPPLAEDEIDQRVGQFDTAVAKIEDEVVEVFATMDVAAHDDDAGHVAGREDSEPGYLSSFGGAPGEDDPPDHDERDDEREDGREDDDVPARETPPAPRRSIDETSRAVELALLDDEHDAEPASPSTAHDEDLAGWSGQDEDEDEHQDEPAAPPSGADRRRAAAAAASAAKTPPEAPSRSTPKPATAPLLARLGLAGANLRSEQSRLRLLVGAVIALSVVLVGGIVWVLLPRPAPPALAPVTLQTSVPGGVSDPDTAIRLPKEAIAVTSSFSLFEGRDPTVFESDPDNPVRFDGELARISTSSASAGAKVIIGAGLSSRLAGKTVRVTLDARSARENGATSMRFAYQSGVAISHWQTANLAADFTSLGMVWRVPALRTDPEGDYIVIEPGLPGSGTGVEIRAVRIDLVDE